MLALVHDVGAPVVRSSPAGGGLQASSVGLATSTWVMPRAPSPAQAQGPCRHACILPRGDDFVHAREGVQDTALSFLPEHEFAAVLFALLQGW